MTCAVNAFVLHALRIRKVKFLLEKGHAPCLRHRNLDMDRADHISFGDDR